MYKHSFINWAHEGNFSCRGNKTCSSSIKIWNATNFLYDCTVLTSHSSRSILIVKISDSHQGIIERVVDRLPLMTYGLKLSLEAWISKYKKKSFNNLRFNELQLNFGNSIFFVKLRYVKYILTNSKFRCKL